MKKKLFKTFFYLCICLLSMNTQILYAQGTKGNTITFDSHNCTQLQSNLASTWFSFLRHNQAPIQILNGNPTANTTSSSPYYHTIAPLQEANGNGIFATSDATIANNMAFSKVEGNLEFYNNYANYNALCFAVIAPRGYRFTEYYMDICSTKATDSYANNDGATDAVITRYTYNEGSTWEYTLAQGEDLTLTGTNSQIYSHTLSNAKNILYFRVTFAQTSSQSCIHMNELRLKYVIDDEFEATIPNSSNENQVRTGILNLGQFTSVGSTYAFTRANVTDWEDVNIVAEDNTSQISVSNGAIEVSKAGTYWIESPAKFRILGAKVNFQMAAGTTESNWVATNTLISGQQYKISNGSGAFLSLANNGTGITNRNEDAATIWTITQTSNGYTIKSNTDRYLCINLSGTLTTQTSSYTWSYNNNQLSGTYGTFFTYTRYIRCNNNSWSAASSGTALTFYYEEITSIGASDYTATLYGTSATTSVGTANLSASNTSASISAPNLNNDGVKFSVTGPAAFTVDLTLLPLDPNLQNLEFDYIKDGVDSNNKVSASATNFKFNNGETIVIPIEPGLLTDPQVVFRNAFNENRNIWYDGTGSGEKVSNYYLVDSEYEKSGSESNAPDDKVNADQAGQNEIQFSNIKDLTANGGFLTETPFNKTNAGYGEITLTNTPKTVYIYSADKPVYRIMTEAGKALNNHIAYTFYDATLQGTQLVETPVVAITQLYTSSLKRNNVKVSPYNQATGKSVSVADDSAVDNNHIFYGVKVTSSLGYGYLTSTQISDAIKTAMESKSGTYTDDVMRSILYVDMSELKSISGDANTWVEIMLGTADNCLFFMPSNFSISQSMIGGGIIAGGENGTAVTDIIINDQQPFFTPYSFKTSTHVARYERSQTKSSTSSKPTVMHSTLVLPFTMKLNANGNLKPTSDSENTNLTFYNLTGIQTGKADNILATPVTTGEATANTPYHIKSANKTETTSFVIEAQGVTFAQTPLNNGGHDLTSPNAQLTAHGTFYGVEIPTTDNILYFSKDYFLNSANLTNGATSIKMLPYRVYYTVPTPSNVSRFNVFFLDNSDDIVDTEEPVVSDDAGIVDAINTVQSERTKIVWYNMNGQKMNNQPTLPGVYVVNGKKVFIKK